MPGEQSQLNIIRVVAVDDTPLIRHAIHSLIAEQPAIDLVAEGSTGDDVLRLVEKHVPDVLLLDLSMPQNAEEPAEGRFRALPTIDRLNELYPHIKIIVLTSHYLSTLVRKAREKGISGYLLKDDDLSLHLPAAIQAVHKGSVYFSETITDRMFNGENRAAGADLTRRQIAVINAIYRSPDASYASLATELEIKEPTFKSHLAKAFAALGVTNKTAAVLKCLELGLIHQSYSG